MMKAKICIGLMSGTSVDGIDVVIAEFRRVNGFIKHKFLLFRKYDFSSIIRKRIFDAMNDSLPSTKNICQLNFELAYLYANAVKNTLRESGLSKDKIFVIGSHGQTIYHIPQGTKENGKKLIASTLQIGDGSIIAEITGIPTVSDFRTRDIAAGGHGAPLVPFADFHLLTHHKKNRVLQNIGGVANLTFLKASGKISDIIAFDNGPGNMIIDYATYYFTKGKQTFDKNGELAGRGKINNAILSELLKHPYCKMKPPKTTGREMFGKEYTERIIKQYVVRDLSHSKDRTVFCPYQGYSKKDIYDFISTVTALTAITITDSYKNFIMNKYRVDEVLLAGGGAYNTTLVKMIKNKLQDTDVKTLEDIGFNSDGKEALSFALLAYATMLNIPNNVPSATGAKKPVVLGKISY